MLPSVHFIVSLFLAVILYPIFGWIVGVILIGGFFIDVDHYLLYLFKKKDYSLRNAYFYFRNNDCSLILKKDIFIFHTIESIVILSALSFYSELFLLINLGVVFHLVMDWIDEAKICGNIKNPSILIWLFNIKKNKK